MEKLLIVHLFGPFEFFLAASEEAGIASLLYLLFLLAQISRKRYYVRVPL